jgi:hypothetical protein
VIITITHIKGAVHWNEVQLKNFCQHVSTCVSLMPQHFSSQYPISAHLWTYCYLQLQGSAVWIGPLLSTLIHGTFERTPQEKWWDLIMLGKIVTYLYQGNQEIWKINEHTCQSGAMTTHINMVTLCQYACMFLCPRFAPYVFHIRFNKTCYMPP